MWLYKDKGGDGVHLNNGEDGGGDWLFHKNGNLHTPAAIYAGGNVHVSWGGRSAIFHENGDVTGPIWGGALSAWIKNQMKSRTSVGDGWWRDENTGYIVQSGNAENMGYDEVRTINFHLPFKQAIKGILVTPNRAGVQREGVIAGYASAIDNASFKLTNDFTKQGDNTHYWWMAVGI